MNTNADPEILKQLLSYDAETGKLTWLDRDQHWFKTPRDCKAWNSRYAGREAFTAYVKGYRTGWVLGKGHYAHRVILAMQLGYWPEATDHINGIKDDNRLCNIRAVNHAENMKNMPISSANSSGSVGVYFSEKRGKWVAQVSKQERTIFLGHYESQREANIARKAASKALSFHENHGARAYRSVQP